MTREEAEDFEQVVNHHLDRESELETEIMRLTAIVENPEKWMKWCDVRVLERAEQAEAALAAKDAELTRIGGQLVKMERDYATKDAELEAAESQIVDLRTLLANAESKAREAIARAEKQDRRIAKLEAAVIDVLTGSGLQMENLDVEFMRASFDEMSGSDDVVCDLPKDALLRLIALLSPRVPPVSGASHT